MSVTDRVVQVLDVNTRALVSLPARLWASLRHRYAFSEKITIGDVDAAMKQMGMKDYAGAGIIASALRALHGVKDDASVVHFAHSFDDGILVPSLDTPSASQTVPPPVDTVPHVPANTQANAQAGEHLRHEAIKNLMDKLPDNYARYAEEFVGHFPRAGVLPTCMEHIILNQDGSLQKARNARALDDGGDTSCTVKAFMKKEAYTECKDPRNISAVSTGFQLELSRYTYAVKAQVLKDIHWYYPGRSLEGIAQALHALGVEAAKDGRMLAETDFSRYDGTISAALRKEVEFATYKQVLSADAWHGFHKLAIQELAAPASVGGRKYDPQGSRLSGSPLTTDGNTVISAYVDYCGNRLDGMDPAESWKCIGAHFGDDGVSRMNSSSKVASDLGLKLKLEERDPRGRVGFLGRIFPLLASTPSSMQDPSRVWPKLTVTLNGAGIPELRAK